MKFPQKVKVEVPYDPAFPDMGIYLNKIKTTNVKKYMHSNVHCSFIHNS